MPTVCSIRLKRVFALGGEIFNFPPPLKYVNAIGEKIEKLDFSKTRD